MSKEFCPSVVLTVLPDENQKTFGAFKHQNELRQISFHPSFFSFFSFLVFLTPPPPFRVEPAGERWLTPGLRKYSCQLTIDTNTVNRKLKLSDNSRKVTHVEKEDQSYPDHPDRFYWWPQLLCRNVLTGRCYWEVEWRGDVEISVSYRGIRRRGESDDCVFGLNDQSWSLSCSDGGYSVCHNKRETHIISSSSSVSNRAAVYVDRPAGTLSFYRVSSDTLIHLHTFNTTFTEEPLHPGFTVWSPVSWLSLC
ncbi:stonustoxin subunit alpha-like [Leuresthes tenuis]|uniref:stonustoxin subunit alpha-like n=1 Tax=Leuresthes tenuis TaxID=355514 RepID=UPI003B506E16